MCVCVCQKNTLRLLIAAIIFYITSYTIFFLGGRGLLRHSSLLKSKNCVLFGTPHRFMWSMCGGSTQTSHKFIMRRLGQHTCFHVCRSSYMCLHIPLRRSQWYEFNIHTAEYYPLAFPWAHTALETVQEYIYFFFLFHYLFVSLNSLIQTHLFWIFIVLLLCWIPQCNCNRWDERRGKKQ